MRLGAETRTEPSCLTVILSRLERADRVTVYKIGSSVFGVICSGSDITQYGYTASGFLEGTNRPSDSWYRARNRGHSPVCEWISSSFASRASRSQ